MLTLFGYLLLIDPFRAILLCRCLGYSAIWC
jgi:hypothetical protein